MDLVQDSGVIHNEWVATNTYLMLTLCAQTTLMTGWSVVQSGPRAGPCSDQWAMGETLRYQRNQWEDEGRREEGGGGQGG